ncbi:syntaxin Ecym_2634 [Eremothecium cymbalariae DBVPG|uniref:t-SNARE coiled-coil homology domain-containing protein n=1 Tax=Eremothecium cymbalariae (strain CBS 270.75 / DBVPG 7215 / KCTC 17166 / NRRL Y-17582) TaxID=931890 RepID=G8JNS1_ERECY|nr:Hypothetical protein Ecym_2634 [Eremothecium cymbalariae DBVPG\
MLQEGDIDVDYENEEDLNDLTLKYNECIEDFPDELINKDLYLFKRKPRQTSKSLYPPNEVKRVRFQENPIEEQEPFSNDMPQFKPCMDDRDVEFAQDKQKLFDERTPTPDGQIRHSPLTNQDLFIHQQQQLMEQDTQLDHLSDSIRRNHRLTVDINREVTDQNDGVLNDLENMLNSSTQNLDRARRRLQIFEKTARENGPCFMIVVLSMILVLLLVVL